MLVRTALLSFVLSTSAAFGQGNPPTAQGTPPAPTREITLDVVVTPRSGAPVAGLAQSDFTLLDNKAPEPITAFRAVTANQMPVEVVLLVDAVNIDYGHVAIVRQQLDKFLRANGGHLQHPTTLAILNDTGVQMQNGFSTDGNALSAALDQQTIGLRDIRRSSGFWGATERLQISLTALRQLAAKEAKLPGRKLVLFLSPGWPLLSGPNVQLSAKQQDSIFHDVVDTSTQLRQAGITIYNVNPLGPTEGLLRANYYEGFLKGLSKPGQADLADLSLQVVAIQSGGLVLSFSNDVAGLIDKCVADANAFYRVTFLGASGEHPDEYHHIDVQLDKPGLVARTRDGYYAQP